MKLTELRRLTSKDLKKMERINKLSFHSMMIASVVLFARAFSEISPLFLLVSFGLVLVSQAFYSNARLVRNLQSTK
jgi:hypothetical protein